MKCMLHEINHFKATVSTLMGLCGYRLQPAPCGPREAPVLGHHHSSLLWFCGLPLLDFSGKWTLTVGASQGEKKTPGRQGDGFWAGCPHMDKTHSPDSVDRGRGPGKQLRMPLGPQLPSGWASRVHVQDAGWLQEAPGHSPCGWVFLRRPMAPPALPLTATGWQQRSPRRWLSPWPAWWPVGRPARVWSPGVGGCGQTLGTKCGSDGVPRQAHPLQCP